MEKMFNDLKESFEAILSDNNVKLKKHTINILPLTDYKSSEIKTFIMSYKSNVYIIKEDNWYVASSIETGIASQGKTMEEALKNLKEALFLCFEDNKTEDF